LKADAIENDPTSTSLSYYQLSAATYPPAPQFQKSGQNSTTFPAQIHSLNSRTPNPNSTSSHPLYPGREIF
jgi:hypothetical protein